MQKHTILFCVLFALVSLTSAFYDGDSKVVKLTASNFKQLVTNSNDPWFIEFYAPWCGHCQRLTPDWKKLGNALDGIIKIGAVDMTTDQEAGAAFGIRGFPTLKFFGADRNKPIDYEGSRTLDDLVKFSFDQARKIADSRLKGGSSGGRQGSQSAGGNQGGQQGGAGGAGAASDKDVIILTDENFESELMESEDLWIVDFYAPWCGHCKNLEPEWSSAATELKGQVKVAKVDATQATGLAERFGIRAFPQIKLFPSGPKSDSLAEEFDGARTSSSIVSWALDKKAQYKPAMKVEQLVSQEVFDNYCANLRGVCFIAFLPHIYDSSANERNDYIEIFKELSKSNRQNPVSFVWAQGGDYYDIEESLGLGSGYPALVAISVNKMKYASLAGSFSQKNIDTWVKTLLAGKQPMFDLRAVPKIKNAKAWDGNDSKPQQEIDL